MRKNTCMRRMNLIAGTLQEPVKSTLRFLRFFFYLLKILIEYTVTAVSQNVLLLVNFYDDFTCFVAAQEVEDVRSRFNQFRTTSAEVEFYCAAWILEFDHFLQYVESEVIVDEVDLLRLFEFDFQTHTVVSQHHVDYFHIVVQRSHIWSTGCLLLLLVCMMSSSGSMRRSILSREMFAQCESRKNTFAFEEKIICTSQQISREHFYLIDRY